MYRSVEQLDQSLMSQVISNSYWSTFMHMQDGHSQAVGTDQVQLRPYWWVCKRKLVTWEKLYFILERKYFLVFTLIRFKNTLREISQGSTCLNLLVKGQGHSDLMSILLWLIWYLRNTSENYFKFGTTFT